MSLEALDMPIASQSAHEIALDLLRAAEAPVTLTGLVQRLGIGRRAGIAVVRDLMDRREIETVTVADRSDVVKISGVPTPSEIEAVGLAVLRDYLPVKGRPAATRARQTRARAALPTERQREVTALVERAVASYSDLGIRLSVSDSVLSPVLRQVCRDGRVICLGKIAHNDRRAVGLYIGRNLFNEILRELQG